MGSSGLDELSCGWFSGGHAAGGAAALESSAGSMLIALLAVLGVDLIVLVVVLIAVLVRGRWVSHHRLLFAAWHACWTASSTSSARGDSNTADGSATCWPGIPYHCAYATVWSRSTAWKAITPLTEAAAHRGQPAGGHPGRRWRPHRDHRRWPRRVAGDGAPRRPLDPWRADMGTARCGRPSRSSGGNA
jgi:hypothetical protein